MIRRRRVCGRRRCFNPTRLSAGNEMSVRPCPELYAHCFNPTRLSAGNEIYLESAAGEKVIMFQSNPAIRRE